MSIAKASSIFFLRGEEKWLIGKWLRWEWSYVFTEVILLICSYEYH
jgi:hypothetical protein